MRTVGMGTSKDDKTPDSALKKENKELKKSVKELTAENTALKKTVEDLTVENTARYLPVIIPCLRHQQDHRQNIHRRR